MVGKFIPAIVKPWLVKVLIGVQKLEIAWYSKKACLHPAPIFVLGNQKSGTSVVAALLGGMTGLSVSLDLTMEHLSTRQSYLRVASGEWHFSKLIERNRLDFSRNIIKEANLTPFYEDLCISFPKSRYVYVLRDPRDNIRSILNRVGIPGDLPCLDRRHLKNLPRGWDIVLDGTALGFEMHNYIESLATRWNLMVEVYLKNHANMFLMRYEDFLKDKAGEICRLAKELGLAPVNDVSDQLDIQYQPRGDRNVTWSSFFGKKNLEKIQHICGDYMKVFGYSKVDELVKGPHSDGFVKSSRSRLANPEE